MLAVPAVEAEQKDPVRRRKTHSKSRNGCLRCKQLRYKCDEGKPSCGRCNERGTTCEYSEKTLAVLARRNTSVSQSRTPDPSPTNEGSINDGTHVQRSPGIFNTLDMGLLSFFMTHTSIIELDDPTVSHIMSTYVVDLALKHEYLLHMILAVAALHKATIVSRSSNEYAALLEASASHQSISSTLFREVVTDVNQDTAEAVFSYTTFVSLYLYASHNPRIQHANDNDFAARLTRSDWLHTLRGTVTLLGGRGNVGTWLDDSPLRVLIPLRGNFSPPVPEDDQWAQAIVSQLRSMDREWVKENPSRKDEIYHETLEHLVECIAQMTTVQWLKNNPQDSPARQMAVDADVQYRPSSFCLSWMFRIPAEFLDLLDAGEPKALVLLAYFGVCLHSLPGNWCLDGFGRTIFDACNAQIMESRSESDENSYRIEGWMRWARNMMWEMLEL